MLENSQIHLALVLHFEEPGGHLPLASVVFGLDLVHPPSGLIKGLLLRFLLFRELPDLLLVDRLIDNDLTPDIVVFEFQLLDLVQQELVLVFYDVDTVHYFVFQLLDLLF